jgi:4-phosphopantoate--beta-alanine ligase
MSKMLPKTHPRIDSLRQRELLVKGFWEGATALEGLIAFGRGEAFDYLIGEKTPKPALDAIRTSAALLLTSENPVISVNGNTSVLCPKELVSLAKTVGGKLEINLFYRTDKRVKVIEKILKDNGASRVYGVDTDAEIKGTQSERRKVDRKGIYTSDTVFVALEDGDRTKALIDSDKMVIAVDLNPLSRTSESASITIVDNVVRAVPLLNSAVKELSTLGREELLKIQSNFDNEKNLKASLGEIFGRI